MSWDSETGLFSAREMRGLETMSGEDLLGALMASDPIVALRALAEMKLNGDEDRLNFLLSQEPFKDHCRLYVSDREMRSRDHEYATMLGLVSESG